LGQGQRLEWTLLIFRGLGNGSTFPIQVPNWISIEGRNNLESRKSEIGFTTRIMVFFDSPFILLERLFLPTTWKEFWHGLGWFEGVLVIRTPSLKVNPSRHFNKG